MSTLINDLFKILGIFNKGITFIIINLYKQNMELSV